MEFGPFDRTLALHSVERTTDLKFMAKLLCSSCGWSLSMHGWMDGWLVRKVEFFPPHRGYIKWTKIGVESYLEQKGKNIITKAIFSEGCSIFFARRKLHGLRVKWSLCTAFFSSFRVIRTKPDLNGCHGFLMVTRWFLSREGKRGSLPWKKWIFKHSPSATNEICRVRYLMRKLHTFVLSGLGRETKKGICLIGEKEYTSGKYGRGRKCGKK